MSEVFRTLHRCAEAVTALLMLLIFVTFIVQVAIRYGARIDGLVETLPFLDPTHFGWTLEFCLALWVWLIFWGNAFVVRRQDHVRFELLADHVPRKVARLFLVLSGLIVGIGLLASVEPTWQRFSILRLKHTATLDELLGDWIRMRDVYTIYIVFLTVVGLRALWSAVRAMRSGDADPALEQNDRDSE